MIKESDVYQIGQLNRPHGVKGEISFTFTTDVWSRVDADYLVCEVDGILVPFFLEEYRFRSDHSALVKFVGTDTVEQAQEMAGMKVLFPYSLTPRDEDEDYTWQSFVGYAVHDTDGRELGTITAVDDSTNNTLFEVGSLLIPAADDLFVDIDHEAKTITMAIPEGLTDLYE